MTAIDTLQSLTGQQVQALRDEGYHDVETVAKASVYDIWAVDGIEESSQAKRILQEARDATNTDGLTTLEGVTPALAEALVANGLASPSRIAYASLSELTAVEGIHSTAKADQLRQEALEFLGEKHEPLPERTERRSDQRTNVHRGTVHSVETLPDVTPGGLPRWLTGVLFAIATVFVIAVGVSAGFQLFPVIVAGIGGVLVGYGYGTSTRLVLPLGALYVGTSVLVVSIVTTTVRLLAEQFRAMGVDQQSVTELIENSELVVFALMTPEVSGTVAFTLCGFFVAYGLSMSAAKPVGAADEKKPGLKAYVVSIGLLSVLLLISVFLTWMSGDWLLFLRELPVLLDPFFRGFFILAGIVVIGSLLKHLLLTVPGEVVVTVQEFETFDEKRQRASRSLTYVTTGIAGGYLGISAVYTFTSGLEPVLLEELGEGDSVVTLVQSVETLFYGATLIATHPYVLTVVFWIAFVFGTIAGIHRLLYRVPRISQQFIAAVTGTLIVTLAALMATPQVQSVLTGQLPVKLSASQTVTVILAVVTVTGFVVLIGIYIPLVVAKGVTNHPFAGPMMSMLALIGIVLVGSFVDISVVLLLLGVALIGLIWDVSEYATSLTGELEPTRERSGVQSAISTHGIVSLLVAGIGILGAVGVIALTAGLSLPPILALLVLGAALAALLLLLLLLTG